MSLTSHALRRLAIAGLTAAAAIGVAAAPASAAQTKTLTYKCKYPLIGTNPLSVKISLDAPATWPAGQPLESFGIAAVATASGNTVPGLALIDGLASIEGVSTATSSVIVPGGAPAVTVKVPITIPKYVLPQPVPDPLVLNAAGSTPPLTIDDPGSATIKLEKLALNLTARDAAGDPIVLPPVTKDLDGNPVVDSDGDPSTFDVYCKVDAGQDTTLANFVLCTGFGCGGGGGWPTVPGNVTGTSTNNSVALSWSPATDDVGVVGYDVYNGPTLVASVTGTSANVTGLASETSYVFTVVAKDVDGNKSAASQPLIVKTKPDVVCDCGIIGKPTNLRASVTATSITLTWDVPAGPVPPVIYNVYNGATKVTTVAGTTATISGLTSLTSYTLKVEAVDASGLGASSDPIVVKTGGGPPPTVHYGYSLAGSTALKTLTKGTLPLKGTIDAQLTLATGAYTADLVLNQTQGQLTALGFLPVTAKIGFVPSGKTTGTLADGVLTSSSKVRIKVQEVKLFGAIPLAGGNNCQTKSLSDINLKSTDAEFVPTVGGTLAGTYAISDLNGCGALNGLVSPLTAGKGNTISLKLTPKP